MNLLGLQSVTELPGIDLSHKWTRCRHGNKISVLYWVQRCSLYKL